MSINQKTTTTRLGWSNIAERLTTNPRSSLLPATTVAAGLAALAAATRPSTDLALYLPAAIACALAVVIDAHTRKIPVILTRAATALAMLTLVVLAAATASWHELAGAGISGAGFTVVYSALVYIPALLGRPSPIGAGDARLAGYLGLLVGWLGTRGIEALAVVPYVTGALEILVRAVARRRERTIAFGPHLVAGLAVALIVAAR